MTGLRKLFVKCWRGAVLLATYEYGVAETVAGTLVMADRETYLMESKTSLTNDGHAFPPYEDIRFEVTLPRL
jgi:hypothetical protein